MLHRQNIFHVLWHPLNFFCFKVQKSFWLRPTTKPWKMSRYFPKNWSLLLVLCCRSFWTQHLDFEEISFRPPTRVSIQTVSQKWLISAKKKSLFRSLCSTFNDLEKFNELKTHTYIILFHLIFLKIYSPTVQFSCSKTIWNWLRKKQLETTAQSFWYHSTDVSLPIPMILQKCWFAVCLALKNIKNYVLFLKILWIFFMGLTV